MLSQGFYLIAAVLVMLVLLRGESLVPGLVAMLQVLVASLIMNIGTALSRWTVAVPLSVLFAGVALAFALHSGMQAAYICYLVGAQMLVAFIACQSRTGYVIWSVGALPATAVAAMFMGDDGLYWAGMVAFAWCLGVSPLLTLILDRRQWLAVLPIGLLGVGVLMVRVLWRDEASWLDLFAIMRGLASHGDNGLAFGQTLLVGLSVSPLFIESSRKWRWVAIAGAALGVGPMAVALLTGPWVDGYPMVVWILAVPGGLAMAVGVFGMLCTVQRDDLLGAGVVRAIALGIGATAAMLLPLQREQKQDWDLIGEVAAAMSPLFWSMALAVLLGLAALVAHRQHASYVRTSALVKQRSQAGNQLRVSMDALVQRFRRTVKLDARNWLHPQGLVPAIILASTAPVMHRLEYLALVPYTILMAVPGHSIARASLPMWILYQFVLLGLVGIGLECSLESMVGLWAIGLAIAWPYARWMDYNPGWALPTTLLAISFFWPWLGIEGVLYSDMAIIAGIGCLMGNLFLGGLARLPVLVLTATHLMAYLLWWVPDQDPFATVQLGDMSMLGEAWEYLRRAPFIAAALLGLWVGRFHFQQRRLRMPMPVVFGVMLPAMVGVLCWALLPSPNWWQALLAWGVFACTLPVVITELRATSLAHVSVPMIDALALVVAILVSAISEAGALIETVASLAGGGSHAVPAGKLGEVLIATVRDLAAVIFTGLILISIRHIIEGRERLVGMVTGSVNTAVFYAKRPRDLLAKIPFVGRKKAVADEADQEAVDETEDGDDEDAADSDDEAEKGAGAGDSAAEGDNQSDQESSAEAPVASAS